jgi:hypothetical protein
MPKVVYNPITGQNEWSYTKKEKKEMLKELEKKPKRKLPAQEVRSFNYCNVHKKHNHIPFNPHSKDTDDTFDWGDRYEN